jgi:hypothetical protein
MKLSPDAVDIYVGKRVSMSAVRQQDENAFVLGIDPTTRSGETRMTKTVRGQCRARR